jgi:hypothetical protein
MRTRILTAVVFFAALASEVFAQTVHRRALLIGINDYSASRLAPTGAAPAPGRVWANLDGALNDVVLMRELLVARKGFAPSDIAMLTDQQATRAAILKAIETQLVAPAKRGDIVLFYYSGHGSQVRNTLSDEADRLDESLVPADSPRGAPDLRDKELRRLFNRILDRGAQLTIVLDSCHSASGARGLDTGMRFRAVKADERDVADRVNGPHPEDRGALVFAAAQDFDLAYELMDAGTIHGAFSWALARAIRDGAPDEPASATFARAEARLRVDMPAQEPVIAGNAEARHRPFLAERLRGGARGGSAFVAIERLSRSGEYIVDGGWVNGLTVGSELRLKESNDVRLEVIALDGMSHAVARGTGPDAAKRLERGALLEIATWAAPPGKPLRICIPRGSAEAAPLAQALHTEALQKGIRWIDDPTETTPLHVLRWRDGACELVSRGAIDAVGAAPLAHVAAGESLFVQVPATAQIANGLDDVPGVELAARPETADYVLAGRVAAEGVEYAWIRPSATASDGSRTALPVRSAWVAASHPMALLMLHDTLERLERVHAWHELASPPGTCTSYSLAVRRNRDGTLIENGTLVGGERYRLVLRARDGAALGVPRYVYVFVIDSGGRSVLLFPSPSTGSVENRLPLASRGGEPSRGAPSEIALGNGRTFVVTEPFGVDTYFLLSTDEPIGCLDCLEWDTVRGPLATPQSVLERLLVATASGTRGYGDIRTPLNWSLDQTIFESIPSGRTAR